MRNVLCIFALSFALAACSDPNAETRSDGVVVHGFESAGWVKNTSPVTLRIKHVFIGHGETTEWIEVFPPGRQRPLPFINQWRGFHIYTLDGVEVGWIRPSSGAR